MDEPISARYVWDAGAMTEALAAHQRQPLPRRWIVFRVVYLLAFFVVLIVLPASLAVDSTSPPESRRNAVLVLIMACSFLSWFVIVVRNKRYLGYKVRKAFRSLPNQAEFVEWTVAPGQISTRTSLRASTILWPLFIKVVEAPKGFLLYQNMQVFNWIPGHAFASAAELARFAELARAKVPNYVVLGECRFPVKPEPVGLDEL